MHMTLRQRTLSAQITALSLLKRFGFLLSQSDNGIAKSRSLSADDFSAAPTINLRPESKLSILRECNLVVRAIVATFTNHQSESKIYTLDFKNVEYGYTIM
jgi:hypothetical protein